MSVEYRAPRNQAELEDSIQCSARAFGGRFEEFFGAIVKHDPWFDLENTRACFVDGKVVSVVQIFDRPMRIGSGGVRMGGLGSVGTDPDYQRCGYNSHLLQDTVRYMEAHGYDLSILGAAVASHYGRAGWVICPTHSFTAKLPETLPGPLDDVSVEQYETDQQVPAPREIYDRFNARRTGTVVRTEEYWRNRPLWRKNDPFWVARRDDAPVAYLVARAGEVREFGFLPRNEDAMQDLLSRFFRQAQEAGVTEVSVGAPSEARGMLETLGCTVRRREALGTMVRLIDFGSTLRKITPVLAARLQRSDLAAWEGRIRIRYEAGEGVLALWGGRITLNPAVREIDIDLAVSQEQLVKLLFGNIRAEQIGFANHLKLDEPAIAVLNVLFPPDELFRWRTDGF